MKSVLTCSGMIARSDNSNVLVPFPANLNM